MKINEAILILSSRGELSVLAKAALILILPVVTVSVTAKSLVAPKTDLQTKETKDRCLSRLDRTLYKAAADGAVSEINRLLDASANVDCVIAGDGSPLIAAARNGRLEAVRLLLERGADPNLAVSGDGNPLIMAAREGHAEVISLLLDRGARIDEVVPGDENALIQASWSGQLAVVKLLVSRGADVNKRVWVDEHPWQKGEWRSPLSMARRGKHKAVADFLLESGAKE